MLNDVVDRREPFRENWNVKIVLSVQKSVSIVIICKRRARKSILLTTSSCTFAEVTQRLHTLMKIISCTKSIATDSS